jgi:hypothetical protein
MRAPLRGYLRPVVEVVGVAAGPVVVGVLFGRAPFPFAIAFAILVAALVAFVWGHRTRPLIVLVALTIWLVVERFALASISPGLTPITLAVLLGYDELFFPLMIIVAAPRIPRVFADSPRVIRAIDLVVIAFALFVFISFVFSPASLLDRLTYARRLTVLPMIYTAGRLQLVDSQTLRRYVTVLLGIAAALAIFGLMERFWFEGLIWRNLIPTMYFYHLQQATGVTTSMVPEHGFRGLPLTYWTFDTGVPMRRLVSTSIEATTMATFFAICTVLAVASRQLTRLRVSLAILLAAATFLTLGKAGIGVVLIGFAYLGAIQWPWVRHPGWIAEAAVAALLVLVGVGVMGSSSGLAETISTGALQHVQGFVEGVNVASSNLFGRGVGIGGGFATVRTGAESTFGTVLVEIGWPGLLLWSGWMLGTAAACALLSPYIAFNRYLGFSVAAALAGLFATASLTESAGGLSGNWPYPLLAGLIVAVASSRMSLAKRTAQQP